MAETAEPTVITQPFPHVTVEIFGRPDNWSIGKRYHDWNRPQRFRRLAALCQKRGIMEVIAPRPTEFNAKIEPQHRANICLKFDAVQVRTGFDFCCDGTRIYPGQALWLSSADCPTIVAYGTRTKGLIVAHAGRDSLVNRSLLHRWPAKQRDHESVVDAIGDTMDDYPSQICVRTYCGIGPNHFTHPWANVRGGNNYSLIEHLKRLYGAAVVPGESVLGRIDLHRLIATQFEKRGVPAENIECDKIDTFTDKDSHGTPRYWSHRRDGASGRNGILVRYQ